MDNGRLKIVNYKGVVYCEAYLNEEYTAADIQDIAAEIRKNFTPPVNVILRKAGSYSLANDGQQLLLKGIKEINQFVYVVDNNIKRVSAEFAASTYMKPYNTRVANSKEEAYKMLLEETDFNSLVRNRR